MAEHVIRAADDIVWESQRDAYSAARRLMFATMRYRIMPTVVNQPAFLPFGIIAICVPCDMKPCCEKARVSRK